MIQSLNSFIEVKSGDMSDFEDVFTSLNQYGHEKDHVAKS